MSTLFAATTASELGGIRTNLASRFNSDYVNEGAYQAFNEPFPAWQWGTPTGVVWMSMTVDIPDTHGGSGSADGNWFTIRDINNELLVNLGLANGISTYTLYGSGSVNSLTVNFGSNVLKRFDLRFEDDGVNFNLDIYHDGLLFDTLTIAADAAGLPQKWIFDNADMSGNVSDITTVSEVFVRDNGDSTLGRHLFQHEADAQGFHTAWEGGFADVNFGGGDLLGAATEKESWTLDNFTAAVPAAVEEVVTTVRYVKPAVGPNTLTGFVRIGGTDYAAADHTLIDQGIAFISWDQNPATLAVWDVAAIDALEIGLEAKTV